MQAFQQVPLAPVVESSDDTVRQLNELVAIAVVMTYEVNSYLEAQDLPKAPQPSWRSCKISISNACCRDIVFFTHSVLKLLVGFFSIVCPTSLAMGEKEERKGIVLQIRLMKVE